MNDPQAPKGGLRRVGRKDRKDRLPPARLEFPTDEDAPSGDTTQAHTATEDSTRAGYELRSTGPAPAAPSENTEEQPQSASPYLAPINAVPPATPRAPDTVRPPDVIYTPPEERFPPADPRMLERAEAAPPMQPQTTPSVDAPYVPRRPTWQYNLVTAFFAVGTLGLCAYYTFLWFNWDSPLNPFPPFTPIPIVVTATPGGFVAPPPTSAPVESEFPFVMSDALYIPNANSAACNWASIAGTVTGLNGEPLDGYRVRIVGEGLNETVFSGSTQTFGAGGFELPIGGAPQEGAFTVRLYTPANVPLSDEYPISTRADCDGSVLVVNFTQVRAF